MLAALIVVALSQTSLDSPRMARLAADPSGVEAFWSEMKEKGTPLFESSSKAGERLITFVWHGDASTKNVVVAFDKEPDVRDLQLARLGTTDVWFRTYRIPAQTRFYYQFSVNDSLLPFEDEKNWSEREKTYIPDPLNPQGITVGTRRFSLAIPPDAPRPSIYNPVPGVPEGVFEPGGRKAFVITSRKLGDHRTWLYTTPGYKGGKANLLVFVDGSGAWQLIPTVKMLDNLFHAKKIGPTVAVYTDSPDRNRDLACNDAYLSFLIDELLPWVKDKYKARWDPKQTIISGRSLGGLFSGYAALERPDVFGNAMMQSPSLWWGAAKDGENEWLTRVFATRKKGSSRFYVAPGIFETATNSRSSISILFSSRHFRDVLRAKGYAFEYVEVAGGHDPLNWETSLPDALLWLLRR